jgi:hypothetical protein
MTFSHFSISVLTNAPNSSGVTTIGVEPSSARCALIFEEASARLNSRLSLPMISAGVRKQEKAGKRKLSPQRVVCRGLVR